MKPEVVEIEIERMEVHVLGTVTQSALLATLERELATLVAERGLPPSMEREELVEVENEVIVVPEGLYGAAMGEEIARRIYEGWWAREDSTKRP